MRLQLIALSLLALLVATETGAQTPARPVRADNRQILYVDSDHTVVGTSTVQVSGATGDITAHARYLLDAITSASIDVVSAATGRFEEYRQEGAWGGSARIDDTTVSAEYIYSIENDWESHNGNLSASSDFLGHDLTVSINTSAQYNHIWRARDQNFSREMWLGSTTLQAVWVASPADIFSLSYAFTWNHGFQASPYRYARIRDDTGLLSWAPESVPLDRMRQAAILRWNHALDPNIALRPHARAYVDDWGIGSATIGCDLVGALGEWEIGGFLRGYAQRGAAFFVDVYPTPARYMTSDRELSAFVDAFGGAWLAFQSGPVGPVHAIRFEARASAFGFWFLEYTRLPQRYGGVFDLALGAEL